MVLMRLMVLWWPSNHQLVKTQVSPSVEYKLHALRKAALPSCRVGPVQSRTTLTEHLDPDNAPTERSRSSYGFSRAPQDEIPKVERKRPSSQTPSHGTSTAHAKHCDFSTPACGSDNMGSIPETEASFTTPINTTAPPEIGTCKPISTYSPHPPPPSPAYTEDTSRTTTSPSPRTYHTSPLHKRTTGKPHWGIDEGPKASFQARLYVLPPTYVSRRNTENWFVEEGVGFIADGQRE
jgi:hypothetical protein